MSAPLHIPALRLGKPYESLDTSSVSDFRTGQELAKLSVVNAGLLRRDLAKLDAARAALAKLSVAKLLEICAQAGELFLKGTLPLGAQTQSAEQYIEQLAATSGLPYRMVRANMAKIHTNLVQMPVILKGLTRGLDLRVLDEGLGEQDGVAVSYYPVTSALGAVLPSNSPGVNSLWLPAIALKTPVVLKPGREEPWTPYRLIQAFIKAGCPAEAFGFYPTDHEGAGAILKACGRSLLFGDTGTTAPYANDPKVQCHGPGYSKVLIGNDEIERWREHLDVIAASIGENGGRSCVNASAVYVPKYGREIAEALAQKLGPLAPCKATDERAALSGFANPKMAEWIETTIEEGLQTPGAEDLAAKHRGGPRKANFEGAFFLRPTIVYCESISHPLANREFLFPYASVVELPQDQMLEVMGHSLVVTAITKDPAFTRKLLASPLIGRLNLGSIPTMQVRWDQPHEGNLFEFLYQRRAIQKASA